MDEIDISDFQMCNGDTSVYLIDDIFGKCIDEGDFEEMKDRVILSTRNREVAEINNDIIDR